MITQQYIAIQGQNNNIIKTIHKPDQKYRKRAEDTSKYELNIRSFQPKLKMDPFE